MGRNAIPKLGEWRDGALYRFRYVGVEGVDAVVNNASNGKMIVYERVTKNPAGIEIVETLACCYADGLQEVMATMFQSGWNKGVSHGKEEQAHLIRTALGVAKG